MLRVCHTKSAGRHLVAKERISPGEVIAVDRAALQVLTPDTVTSHCSHCMVSTLAPLHCPECHGVVFCSQVCSTAALQSYHRPVLSQIVKFARNIAVNTYMHEPVNSKFLI